MSTGPRLVPLAWNWTPVMPTIVGGKGRKHQIGPDRAAGKRVLVSRTVGATRSVGLLTVTFTPAEVVKIPPPCRALPAAKAT